LRAKSYMDAHANSYAYLNVYITCASIHQDLIGALSGIEPQEHAKIHRESDIGMWADKQFNAYPTELKKG
jgi:hypothetical protein